MKLLLRLFLFISISGFSQVGGESVYSFLNVPTSARQADLAGKALTLIDDVNQPFWNPSTIGLEMDNQYCQNSKMDSLGIKEKQLLNYKSLLIPTVLIGYGVFSIKDKDERQEIVNTNWRELLGNHKRNFILDDIAQYTPTISVFALNAMGIKGKHNFLDLTIILGTAYLISGVTVKSIKSISNIQRPDATSFNAFPSGHTATAFMGAELLYQEYKDESIWYGVAGYVVATATAYSRVKNKRHWVSDVVTGAGIGILSTKLAYLLHPIFKRVFFKKEGKINGIAVPYLNKDTYGLAMSFSF